MECNGMYWDLFMGFIHGILWDIRMELTVMEVWSTARSEIF